MAKKKSPGTRKRRTREHVIADLSANYVERYILRCGFTSERIRYDYGLDLGVATFNPAGELENGWIWLQLKATDQPRRTRDGQAIAVRVERGHVLHWLNEIFPVALVVYDAQEDTAYWLDLQAELGEGKVFQLHGDTATLTLQVPVSNAINEDFVRHFAHRKNEQMARWAKGGSP